MYDIIKIFILMIHDFAGSTTTAITQILGHKISSNKLDTLFHFNGNELVSFVKIVLFLILFINNNFNLRLKCYPLHLYAYFLCSGKRECFPCSLNRVQISYKCWNIFGDPPNQTEKRFITNQYGEMKSLP